MYQMLSICHPPVHVLILNREKVLSVAIITSLSLFSLCYCLPKAFKILCPESGKISRIGAGT